MASKKASEILELRRQGLDIDPAVYTVSDLRAGLTALKGGRR